MSRSFPRLVLGGGVVLGLGGEPFQIRDMRNELPVHETKVYGQRPVEAIDMMVVHHLAVEANEIYTSAQHQVFRNQWPAVGYHFGLPREGGMEVLNDLTTWSYHASGHNYHSIGVVFYGNYQIQEATAEQVETFRWLQEVLGEQLGIGCYVLHRDLKATLCPGDKLVPVLREIIEDTCIVS